MKLWRVCLAAFLALTALHLLGLTFRYQDLLEALAGGSAAALILADY